MYLQLADYFALFGYFSVVIGIGFWVIFYEYTKHNLVTLFNLIWIFSHLVKIEDQ
jgi:hypothetical protein